MTLPFLVKRDQNWDQTTTGLERRKGNVPNLLIQSEKPLIVTAGERRPNDQSLYRRKDDGSGSNSVSTLSE
jgi:hypothetical protein